MARGQLGFEMLIVFTIAITLVIWSSKLVDSLESGNVAEKMQVKTISELVNNACSTNVRFSVNVPCSFENGNAKSYVITAQNNLLTVSTGSKSATATTLCTVNGGPITQTCTLNDKVCLTPLNGVISISNGECA